MIIKTVTINQKPVITICCNYSLDFIVALREMGARWNRTTQMWHISASDFNLHRLQKQLGHIAKIIVKDPSVISSITRSSLPSGYYELLLHKRYSPNTIKTYKSYFLDFMDHFRGENLDGIGSSQINDYLLDLVICRNISRSQQNQRINAIKFYYEKVLGRDKKIYRIERPRKDKKLPSVVSKFEIRAMLDQTENFKHRCIIELLYSTGMRRSELINLKSSDIDSNRMVIKVLCSKGFKDRYAQLSITMLDNLRIYYANYRPVNWLFEGARGGKYSGSSVLSIVKKAAANAGIKKKVTPHTLRHSYATHHLEMGTDIRLIQAWLGHENLKTTQIYTHVSENNFKNYLNPLDEISKE